MRLWGRQLSSAEGNSKKDSSESSQPPTVPASGRIGALILNRVVNLGGHNTASGLKLG